MADEKTWQPLELIKVTAEYLTTKSVPSPRLDAEMLLCHVLGLPRRVDLYAGFEREISGKELASYRELIRRRAAREPVSRILGRREFMGIAFAVTPDVLSPRPETELLVEAALEKMMPKKATLPEDDAVQPEALAEPEALPDDAMAEELARMLDSYGEDVLDEADLDKPATIAVPKARPQPMRRGDPLPRQKAKAKSGVEVHAGGPELKVLDLGTGSGCIAVALAAHCPRARVVAVDASPKALAVAKKNAAGAKVAERVEFRQGDWYAACRSGESYDIIVSNPPYLVEGDEDIWPEVSAYDPPAALYGGNDGLDPYRRIVPDTPLWLAPEGWIFLEVGAGQAGKVADLMRRRGFRDVQVGKDYGGVERVVMGMAPEL
ncbi:MAG: peptide chain release factor N(5)-glutamine methyltransferase [Planctomycetaceae bacterium]|nr:peptide chain release factor N(5)-glutamine methyltransferase [Planctomycetaceae bacterium]